MQKIKDFVKKNEKQLIVAGHSLAALVPSIYYYRYIKAHKIDQVHVYTYDDGSKKLGVFLKNGECEMFDPGPGIDL